MILVTGGSGFIGSNLIRELNNCTNENILLVDDLTDGKKIHNIADLKIHDYIDKDDFLKSASLVIPKVSAVFHLGACSSTNEWNGKFLLKNNFEYSKCLYHECQSNSIPFLYASSASVYGLGKTGFSEKITSEKPLNAYAYSKFLFDQYVRSHKTNSQVVGLRYFNVFGQGEDHKQGMSSPIYTFTKQLLNNGCCKLFSAYDGYEAGEHNRDFISVNDAVKVKLWFLRNTKFSGIYNVGTGQTTSFNKIAQFILEEGKNQGYDNWKKSYVNFPEPLKSSYQSHTRAELSKLASTGFNLNFEDIEKSVKKYTRYLIKNAKI